MDVLDAIHAQCMAGLVDVPNVVVANGGPTESASAALNNLEAAIAAAEPEPEI